MIRQRALPFLLLGASLLGLSACGGATQNVRAYRAYMYESPSLAVALDRTEDLARSLELVDQLLLETPYTPGDEWIRKVPLDDKTAAAIKEELRAQPPYSEAGGDYEVPIAKIYRTHLERTLASAPQKGATATYPSLLDAMGDLGEGSKDVKAHWLDHREKVQAYLEADAAYEKAYAEAYPPGRQRNVMNDPPALIAARKVLDDAKDAMKAARKALDQDITLLRKANPATLKEKAQVLTDVTAGVSVAFRIDLEAAALIPIVAVQAVRAIPKAATEARQRPSATLKGITQLTEVPDLISRIKEKMSRQIDLLDLMTTSLAAASRTTVEATPGFAMKESVVDQVVGVTLDSIRANLKAGAEIFLYNNVKKNDSEETNPQTGSKVSYNFQNRLRRLEYDFKPIKLAAFNFNVGFDYIKLPNAANFNLGYKTDRVFSSGGSIENGSFGQALGVSGVASDALDIGLGILGVKTSVRLATFTSGTITLVEDKSGAPILLTNPLTGQQLPAQAPFQIKFTQIDAGYDLSFLMGESAGKYYIEELVVGARYFEYSLPRILYELENQLPPGGEDKSWTVFNESLPQVVKSKYYMGGVTVRSGGGAAPVFSPFLDLAVYVGAGPTSFFMRYAKAVECKGPNAKTPGATEECVDPDSQGKGDNLQKKTPIAVNMTLALGGRLRLVKPGRRFKLNAEVQYRAELIYQSTSGSTQDTGKEHTIEYGATDVFHGPRLNLVGEF